MEKELEKLLSILKTARIYGHFLLTTKNICKKMNFIEGKSQHIYSLFLVNVSLTAKLSARGVFVRRNYVSRTT